MTGKLLSFARLARHTRQSEALFWDKRPPDDCSFILTIDTDELARAVIWETE